MTTHASIGTIDTAQASQYRADGYLVVRQVFSADQIAELDAEADRLRQRTDLIDTNNIRCRWQNDVETGECRFDCFDPVIDLSAVCERTARDPRLLDIVGTLYGEPACLFKDKLIFKSPGTLGLQAAPGLHLLEIVSDHVPDRDRGDRCRRRRQRGDRSVSRLSPAGLPHSSQTACTTSCRTMRWISRRGSCSIWRQATSRSSAATRRIAPAPNRSSEWRRLLYLSYNALSDGGEQRDQHYAEFRGWLQDRYAEYGRTSTFFR